MKKYDLDKENFFSKNLFKNTLSIRNLSVGDRVILKHYSMFDYTNAYILDVFDDFVKIALKNNMLELGFSEKDPLTISYNIDNKFYVAAGEIETIDSVEPPIINVKLLSVQKKDSLRKSERFYVSLTSLINSDVLGAPVFAVVKNLSLGGFKVTCSSDLDMNDAIDITVSIDNYYSISCKGEIIRKLELSPKYEYGIQITDISQTNLITFNHYINQLKNGLQ